MKPKSNGAGSVIAEKREKMGLSRNELAVLSKVSITTLNRIELGYCMPSADTLDSLAKILKLTAADVALMWKRQETYLLSLKEKAKLGKKEEAPKQGMA